MTQPHLISGDELDAFVTGLLELEPCPDCDGQPAVLVNHGTVQPLIAHRVDCPDVLADAVDNALRLILGGQP